MARDPFPNLLGEKQTEQTSNSDERADITQTSACSLEMKKKEESDISMVRIPSPTLHGEKQTMQTSNLDKEADTVEFEYVTGFKLAIVIVSVTMVAFILMLDSSIIATVSQHSAVNIPATCLVLIVKLGYSSHHQWVPFSA